MAVRKSFVCQITPFLSDPDGWIAQCAPAFGDVVALDEKLIYYRRHNSTVSNAFKGKQKNFLQRICGLFKVQYQNHFTWPSAEQNVYNKLLYYIKNNGNRVDSKELEKHLEYLDSICDAQKRGVFSRIKTLKALFDSGEYQKYRGNKNTYRLDKAFMVINAFTKR